MKLFGTLLVYRVKGLALKFQIARFKSASFENVNWKSFYLLKENSPYNTQIISLFRIAYGIYSEMSVMCCIRSIVYQHTQYIVQTVIFLHAVYTLSNTRQLWVLFKHMVSVYVYTFRINRRRTARVLFVGSGVLALVVAASTLEVFQGYSISQT